MHVHGMGTPRISRERLKPALALIPKPPAAAARRRRRPHSALDTARAGEDRRPGRANRTGPVYKITIGRPDIDLREHGAADQRAHGPEYLGRLYRL